MPDLIGSAVRSLRSIGGGPVSPIVNYSSDTSTWQRPSRAQLRAIADASQGPTEADTYAAFLGAGYIANGLDAGEQDDYRLLAEIARHKGELEGEQSRLRANFRRLDNLYYPETVTDPGGPDHWPEGGKKGRVHISLNTPPVYVDIPASLQAVPPVENYVANAGSTEEEAQAEREAAARAERLYFQWKEDVEFELEIHKACIVKGLYGFTYAKVWWDADEKMPRWQIIDTPENLYVGWGDSDYRRMDWTVYCYSISPQVAMEDYGVTVTPIQTGDTYTAYVSGTHDDPIGNVSGTDSSFSGRSRQRSDYENMQVHVYDYWYKKPAGKGKDPEVWNAIFVGNEMVENARHRELDRIPYLALPNTFIPGSPYGRSELWDLEQIFREKDERLSEGAQMIHSIVGGQMWQLVGPEASDTISDNMIPKPNKVATPGQNAEIKAIQPFVGGQYALEDYLKRLDGELETLSGLNDLLIGRAPATILGSSKAITALVANYEARIRMKRQILYRFRKELWALAASIWEAKDKDIAEILDGRHRLHIIEPELTPRDQLENAQKAINLVQNRIWSMRRAMDATGVEDPEEELNIVRQEQTDPALNPAAVQTQVGLAATMRQLGVQPGQGAAPPTQAQTENSQRQSNRPAAGGQSLNAPENQGNPPPEAQPANARGGLVQTMISGGEGTNRILTQTDIPQAGQ